MLGTCYRPTIVGNVSFNSAEMAHIVGGQNVDRACVPKDQTLKNIGTLLSL